MWLIDAETALGDHARALQLAEQLWQAAQTRPSRDPADQVAMLGRYTTALQHVGRLDDAEALYPQLIERTRAARGPRHPDVLIESTNQCGLWLQRGELDRAVAGMREVVARYAEWGLPFDANHLIASHNLGQVLNQSGRFAEAEPFLARAAQLTHELLDARDASGALMRFNYGACLAWQRRWPEAEPILLAEFANAQQLLPPDHPNLAKLRRTLVAAYRHNGHADAAEQWLTK